MVTLLVLWSLATHNFHSSPPFTFSKVCQLFFNFHHHTQYSHLNKTSSSFPTKPPFILLTYLLCYTAACSKETSQLHAISSPNDKPSKFYLIFKPTTLSFKNIIFQIYFLMHFFNTTVSFYLFQNQCPGNTSCDNKVSSKKSTFTLT